MIKPKSVKWRVKVVSNSGGESYLIDNRGNTKFCYATAKKYASEFIANFASDYKKYVLCEV